MAQFIDPQPDQHFAKESTGLGGDTVDEGSAHGLRGVVFLTGLALVAVFAIFIASALGH